MMLPSVLSVVLATAVVIAPAGAVPCRDKGPQGAESLKVPPASSPQAPSPVVEVPQSGKETPASKVVSTVTGIPEVKIQPPPKTKCNLKNKESKDPADTGSEKPPAGNRIEKQPIVGTRVGNEQGGQSPGDDAGRKPASEANEDGLEKGTGEEKPRERPFTIQVPVKPKQPSPPARKPAVATNPSPAAEPAVPEREAHTNPKVPKNPEAPKTTEALKDAEVPATPEAPKTPKAPEVPKTPETPNKPSTPNKPEQSGTVVSVTPHEQYSSSIGVLGCKININRVAYWPGAVNCTNICVKLTHQGRSLKLLKIDSSTGAHDISYDAWNYLAFGKGAQQEPHAGGGIDMVYDYVPDEECRDLLNDGVLPLSASNSMNYYGSCKPDRDSWAGQNSVLYNIQDARCSWGADEKCEVNLAAGENLPRCPSGLGIMADLGSLKVTDIPYPRI